MAKIINFYKNHFAKDKNLAALLLLQLITALFFCVYLLLTLKQQVNQVDVRFNSFIGFHDKMNWNYIYIMLVFSVSTLIAGIYLSVGDILNSAMKKMYLLILIIINLVLLVVYSNLQTIIGG